MQPFDQLPPPPERRPPPPRHFGRSNAWAAQHPFWFAMLAGVATTVVFPLALWAGGGRDPYLDYLTGGLALGALIGTQAYFVSRPVAADRLPRALAIVALIGWIVGMVLGGTLFGGGIIVAGLVGAAYLGNRTALAKQARSERARAAFGPTSDR